MRTTRSFKIPTQDCYPVTSVLEEEQFNDIDRQKVGVAVEQ
jgi:hypothetical protein